MWAQLVPGHKFSSFQLPLPPAEAPMGLQIRWKRISDQFQRRKTL